jgi:hypothetical protein
MSYRRPTMHTSDTIKWKNLRMCINVCVDVYCCAFAAYATRARTHTLIATAGSAEYQHGGDSAKHPVDEHALSTRPVFHKQCAREHERKRVL